jgi:hypothetical protein
LKKVFPEKSRHRSLKYFAEKLQQPEFQAKTADLSLKIANLHIKQH